ncbi:MAG: type II toxin-antitoxin system RelE/ParE family toxin [Eubacterium sp.]|nr:type II toxin-antitoxin system RelE/ParE family toxin [Eubacterium sp.]
MDYEDEEFDPAHRWEVIATDDVQEDLDAFVYYLLVEKMNDQAATALIDDYEEVIDDLEGSAGAYGPVNNPRLATLGYKKILLKRHNYYLIYRIEGEKVFVEHMYHGLQDKDGVFD